MKTVKLPAKLTIALANYYITRGKARSHSIGKSCQLIGGQKHFTTTYSPDLDWDKDACLAKIGAALPKGWGYQACAGTFWFFRPTKKKRCIKTDEDSWPLGEIEK